MPWFLARRITDFYPRPPRGGRRFPLHRPPARRYFYPRPPRGGRPATSMTCSWFMLFLSTPSARRATQIIKMLCFDATISIHALREEGDVVPHSSNLAALIFLSTPSARRATSTGRSVTPATRNFYPRPPRGGRPHNNGPGARPGRFLSTPSARRATGHHGRGGDQ